MDWWNVTSQVGQIKLNAEAMLEMVTENLHTKFQPIRMKQLSVITIYTQIASGYLLLAVHSQCPKICGFGWEMTPNGG